MAKLKELLVEWEISRQKIKEETLKKNLSGYAVGLAHGIEICTKELRGVIK